MVLTGAAMWLAMELSHVVFLNFADGSTRVSGGAAAEDASINASSLEGVDGFAPKFAWRGLAPSREQSIDRITAALAAIYAPFNVRFTTERPSGARYTMVLIGGKGSDLGYTDDMTGLGRVDCDNRTTDEIVFVFPGEAERTPSQTAAIIAHELGHSFGLAHDVAASDLMFPAVGSLGQTFEDAESRLVRPGTCGRSVQNSFRVLAQTLGLRADRGVRPSPSPASSTVTIWPAWRRTRPRRSTPTRAPRPGSRCGTSDRATAAR